MSGLIGNDGIIGKPQGVELDPYEGNVQIVGDLKVTGSFYQESTGIVTFNDAIVELNANYYDDSFTGRGGLQIYRGEDVPATMVYDATDDKFYIGKAASHAFVKGSETGDFSFTADTNDYVKIDIDNIGAVTVQLTDGTAQEVADQINQALYNEAVGYNDSFEYVVVNSSDNLIIRSENTGVSGKVDVQTVANDAYTVLGFSVATTENGVAEDLDSIVNNTQFTNHTSDATIHFTEASIDHANIQNVGTTSHADIDSHIAATGNSVHGLGTISTQDSDSVSITGGTIGNTTTYAIDASGFSGNLSGTDTDVLTALTTIDAMSGGIKINDVEIINSSREATFVSVDSNTITGNTIDALLTAHDYQYCYDWSALPTASNHKWSSVVSGTTSISDGILHMESNTGEYINYYRETGDIKRSDTIIIEHRCKVTDGDDPRFNLIASITESEETVSGSTVYRQFRVSGYDGAIYINGVYAFSLDIDNYHTYKIIKDKNSAFYLFVDEVLCTVTEWSTAATSSSSAYYNGRNLLFGPYFASTIYKGEMYSEYFKYSKLREGSKDVKGKSGEFIGGSVDVKNQAETEGVQITSTGITSTGTNQDIEIDPDGTGNTNFKSGAVELAGTERIKSDGSYVNKADTTGNRPGTPTTGQCYFDTTLGYPIWYDGSNWVDSAGTTV